MAREPIPTWCFAVAVVRKGNLFLIVQERKHDQQWYLPAGRVEPGESFADAARREPLEAAGIPISLTGILRVEHTPGTNGARLRVVCMGEPTSDDPPKTVADHESLGAAWVSLDQLAAYPLRSNAVRELFEYVTAGGPVYPLNVLQAE